MTRVSLVAALVVSSACAGAHAGFSPAPAPTTVTPSLVRFAIPLGRDTSGTWRWYNDATRDNEDEYVWQIRVDGKETFWFGYALFKYPGRTSREGSIAALLAAGQASVFRKEGRTVRRLPDVAPVLSVDRDRLLVELRDSAVIAAVFAGRPPVVHIETKMPDQRPATYAVPITYSGFRVP